MKAVIKNKNGGWIAFAVLALIFLLSFLRTCNAQENEWIREDKLDHLIAGTFVYVGTNTLCKALDESLGWTWAEKNSDYISIMAVTVVSAWWELIGNEDIKDNTVTVIGGGLVGFGLCKLFDKIEKREKVDIPIRPHPFGIAITLNKQK